MYLQLKNCLMVLSKMLQAVLLEVFLLEINPKSFVVDHPMNANTKKYITPNIESLGADSVNKSINAAPALIDVVLDK